MGTLTKKEIEHRLEEETADSLVITPLLSGKQIGDVSVDLRLGNQFIVFRTHTLGAFDIDELKGRLRQVQERHIVPFGKHFVLHPGMLALGATFEYVSLPGDLECQVEGRSSWARVGLQIATASSVEPLFHGVITLELSNTGTIPLRLYPGIRIAQLVFHEATPKIEPGQAHEQRKYHGSIGPEFSRVYSDKDMSVFVQDVGEGH